MDTSTPDDAKHRVNKATAKLTKRRCLITNIESNTATDYAHVLARAIENDESVMDSLEYSWKIGWRTQNIHTRYNIFRLSAKFHHLFDAKKWLLLPETHIIDQYEGMLEEPVLFPKIKERAYKYKLVAHPDMKQVPIHRRDERISISPSAFEKFIYPFEGFPDIISHVHPRFVICDAGRKLAGLNEIFAFAEASTKFYTMLQKVSKIYEAWATSTPKNRFYEVENEPKAQLGHVRPDRECASDVPYAESSGSSTPPTVRKRNPRPQSVVDGTPEERAPDYYSISEQAKLRVDQVAAKRCLIENTNGANALDYAHLLPRSTKGSLLTSLEYSWGMYYNSLNVDTRRNIFLLSKTFHRLFDGRAWLLLPEEHIIEKYYKVKGKPEEFPVIEAQTYRYTLIVNDLMEHVPIHVQRDNPSSSADGKDEEDSGAANDNEEDIKKEKSSDNNIDFNLEDAFAAYTYPFRHFPTIVSHVHPRFVICNAGAKMVVGHIGSNFITNNPLHKDILFKVHDIYKAWITTRSRKDFLQAKTLHRDNPADGCSDGQTEPERLPPPPPKRPPPEGDGSPKSGKRAKSGGNKDSAWLDDATLGGLDPDRSPKKAWQDKVEWIQTWVGQVPLDAMEEIPMEIDLEDESVCRTPDRVGLDWEEINSVLSA